MSINKYISVLRKLLKRNADSQKAVILSFKFLGDTVFTIPAIDLLRRNFPQYRYVIYCYKENKSIYELYFKDLEYVCLEKSDWNLENRILNTRIVKAINTMRKQKPALLLDLTSNYKTSLVSFFSGSGITLGFGNSMLKSFYDIFVPINKNCHQFDMFLSPVRALKINEENINKRFDLNVKAINNVLINPFAGWSAKEWNFNKFLDLAVLLKKEYRVSMIVQKKLISSDQVKQVKARNIDLILSQNIEDLISEVKLNDLVISNDTGIIYIGALLGKYTFTIYGPTNPIYHAPAGKGHAYVQKAITCSPKPHEKMCNTFGGRIGCNSFECMKQLETNEVYTKINSLLTNIKEIENNK